MRSLRRARYAATAAFTFWQDILFNSSAMEAAACSTDFHVMFTPSCKYTRSNGTLGLQALNLFSSFTAQSAFFATSSRPAFIKLHVTLQNAMQSPAFALSVARSVLLFSFSSVG
jgi:hypothetical protein